MDFERVEKLAIESKKLTKKIDKLISQFGPMESWKQAIRIYCLAAGIKSCARCTKRNGSFYTDMEFRFGDISMAVLWIEKLVEDMRRYVGDLEDEAA
jgi:hypothetical protein